MRVLVRRSRRRRLSTEKDGKARESPRRGETISIKSRRVTGNQ